MSPSPTHSSCTHDIREQPSSSHAPPIRNWKHCINEVHPPSIIPEVIREISCRETENRRRRSVCRYTHRHRARPLFEGGRDKTRSYNRTLTENIKATMLHHATPSMYQSKSLTQFQEQQVIPMKDSDTKPPNSSLSLSRAPESSRADAVSSAHFFWT